MKEIKLSQGKVAIVDDEDFERLNQYGWYAQKGRRDNWYAAKKDKQVNGRQKVIWMHREILSVPEEFYTDHVDGNGLNNLKSNLRLATNQENMQNKKQPHRNNKLGIKGVHWNKREEKFVAHIQFNNKRIHLGYFNVLGDADSDYRKAEEKYFGEFVRCHT